MRDELPNCPYKRECGVVNLDISKNPGSHWVAYAKNNQYIEYFDSYGNLKPPKEIINYLGCKVHYNYENIQGNHPFNCGHLCLKFLRTFWHRYGIK